ncbi:MAG: TIGR03790 family protein [Bryobacter sp.]|nr:TIGR03790 family protein [Bryobacter sp.]
MVGVLVVARSGNAAPPEVRRADRVLVVVNELSARSRRLGEFYQKWHGLEKSQVCPIRTADASRGELETVSRQEYLEKIEGPIGRCLAASGRVESTWYLVLTQGIPLRIRGAAVADWRDTEQASVDNELPLLYAKLRKGGGPDPRLRGSLRNPYFEMRHTPFRHPDFPIYLVTRLAGYSFEDARRAVERCRGAKNEGKVVLDLRDSRREDGNNWLRAAAVLTPAERVVLEEGERVVANVEGVLAYASWGSNDPARRSRRTGFRWQAGAIAAEYVSTSARTLREPPRNWTLGSWKDPRTWFAGSPQSMILDYVWEGVSGIAGATDEPYLSTLPRPDYFIPAYLSGRNLAESFYLSLPVLSWQILIVGDPLCSLR